MSLKQSWTPDLPHSALHGSQSQEGVTTHGTGHGGPVHGVDDDSDVGHAMPPLSAGFVIVRVHVYDDDLPHAAGHEPHCQALTWQSCGQGAPTHGCDSVSGGHGLPPLAGVTSTDLVQYLVPLAPHVALHVPHVNDDVTQSRAHGSP